MSYVLVVDDNRLNQLVAAGALRASGHEVHSVGTGMDAIAACGRHAFDAIVMDVMMPDMDGYEAVGCIRALQASTGAPRIPIIGASARCLPSDRQLALSAGFDDYLTKPLRRDQLDATIVTWVSAAGTLGTPAAAGRGRPSQLVGSSSSPLAGHACVAS